MALIISLIMDKQEQNQQSYLKISKILKKTQEKLICEITNISERKDPTNTSIDQSLSDIYDMCKSMTKLIRFFEDQNFGLK